MTTNHIEKLDPALIRPGRVDVMELIDDANPLQARELFTRFYADDGLGRPDLESLSATLEEIVDGEMKMGRRISMAALQGLFIRNSAKEAIALCRDLFVTRPAP